jgi:crotonobetaine/carnitine-CoA ligase
MATTMATFLTEQAVHYGDEPMLRVNGDGRSYRQLLDDARALAHGLSALGMGSGTRVAIIMDNSHEAVDAWFAASLLGCIEAPLNVNYRGTLLTHLLSNSAAEFVIVDEKYADQLEGALAGLPRRPTIIVNGSAGDPANGAVRLADAYDRSPGWQPDGFTGGEVILYTSGTTGPSKGVVHNQRGGLLLAQYVAEVCGYRPGDRLLNFFPLYHQNARYTGVLAAIAAGAAIDLEQRFTSSRFWDLCRERGVTAFNYLGSVLNMIMSASGPEDPARDRNHPVRIGWGAGASEKDRAEFKRRFGVDLIEVYGLSEAPMATVNPIGSGYAPGSAGREGKFFQVRVVNDAGQVAAPGEPGEIQLRPKMDDVFMRGYNNDPAATVAATRDLWFHSGDRGYLTEDGDLFFTDRLKDSLRRRGENISAWEVESVITADPRVREAAVYGVVVDGEEEVAAALVLETPNADVRQIIRDVAGNLPRYAVPRYVRAVPDLPRTPTLKVQKSELRGAGITPDTYDLNAEN